MADGSPTSAARSPAALALHERRRLVALLLQRTDQRRGLAFQLDELVH
jgi:hypothetical protein